MRHGVLHRFDRLQGLVLLTDISLEVLDLLCVTEVDHDRILSEAFLSRLQIVLLHNRHEVSTLREKLHRVGARQLL